MQLRLCYLYLYDSWDLSKKSQKSHFIATNISLVYTKCIKSQFLLTLKFLQVGTLFFQPIFLLQYLVHNLLSTYLQSKVTCKHDTISQKFRVRLLPLHLILFIASRGPWKLVPTPRLDTYFNMCTCMYYICIFRLTGWVLDNKATVIYR